VKFIIVAKNNHPSSGVSASLEPVGDTTIDIIVNRIDITILYSAHRVDLLYINGHKNNDRTNNPYNTYMVI